MIVIAFADLHALIRPLRGDLALLHWQDGRFVLEEVAPGFTPQEVMALGDMAMTPAPHVGTMA